MWELKKVLADALRRAQGAPGYGRIAKLFAKNIIVREAQEVDLEEVFRWLSPGRQSCEPGINVTNFVAKKRGRIIGFVQLVRHLPQDRLYPGYWLFSLRVKALYCRMGVGTQLCQAVEEKAHAEGATELMLLVNEDNQRAIHLDRKLGFAVKIIPELEAKLEKEKAARGERMIVMSKALN